MKDALDPLLNSWFDLLEDQLTFDSKPVIVYPGDPANNDYFHHVILRAESETDSSNKSLFVTKPVITVDIVTVHPVSINKSVVNNIKNQVLQLLYPTRKCALPPLVGLQITNVIPESSTYLENDDGTRKYHRNVTRFIHRITQI